MIWIEDEHWNTKDYICPNCRKHSYFEILNVNRLPFTLEVKCLNCNQNSHAQGQNKKEWVKFMEIPN